MKTFTTRSGTIYQWDPTPREGGTTRVRRVPPSPATEVSALRRDGEWLTVYDTNADTVQVGHGLVFLLEGLGDLPVTHRRTSPIVSVEYTS